MTHPEQPSFRVFVKQRPIQGRGRGAGGGRKGRLAVLRNDRGGGRRLACRQDLGLFLTMVMTPQGLNGYWKSLDARAARTAAQVKHLQEVRYQEGEGTAYESQRAKAYFASGGSAAAADAPAPARDGKAHAAPAAAAAAAPSVLGKGNVIAGGQERAAVAGFFDGLPRTDVAKTGWLAANRRAEARQTHVREREERSERTEAAPIDDFWDMQERADRQEGRRHGVRAMSREHDEVLAKNEKEIKDEWVRHSVHHSLLFSPLTLAINPPPSLVSATSLGPLATTLSRVVGLLGSRPRATVLFRVAGLLGLE
jgi:hypothetical protein